MKYLKNSKSISLIIVVMMILQLTLPSSLADAADLPTELNEFITNVSVLVETEVGSLQDIEDIDNYQPQNGDVVSIKVDFALPKGHDFIEGSKLKYVLPNIFTTITGSGPLGEIGQLDFEVIDGVTSAVVTFNDSIRAGGVGLATYGASFTVGAEYSEINELVEYVLELPGQADIILNFKPVGGQTITKSGEAENNGLSSNYVTWTVDVNTELNTLKDANLVDKLIQNDPGKHIFKKTTVKAYELAVNAKGEITQSTTEVAITAVVATTTSAAITATYNAENTEVVFTLPDGKKAYRIVYQSEIDENDSNDGKATYENKASFTNGVISADETALATVNWGSPLEKSVSRSNRYGKSANWIVKYNYNRKTIAIADAVLIDKITGDHIIDEAIGVKVYDENNIEINSSSYSVDIDLDKKGYTLRFNNEVNQPYQIKYTTVRSDYLVKSGKVSNIVTRGNDDKTAIAKFSYVNPAIDKIAMGIDYNTKTIKWGIRINRDSYTMENIIVTDIYSGEGMKYIDGTLEVSGLTSDQYTFTDNELTGFTFTTNPGLVIDKPFTIIFKTDYTIEDVGTNDRQFENTASVKWNVDGKEYNSSNSAVAYMHKDQKANGYKNGNYNYETKEFNWAALINFNNNTLENAIFKDYLPEGQEVNMGSITLQPVTLNADGTAILAGVPITTAAVTSSAINAFEIGLGKITGPYLITYSSVDKDGFLPRTAGNVKIKNKAELWDETSLNAEWSDEVTVVYTDETITKFGSGDNKTSLIDWNFKLNYSQSELSNVRVVDTVGKDDDNKPNQLILENSFRVYEVSLVGDGNDIVPTESLTEVTGDEGVYTFVYDQVNGTFILDFVGTITKAYYVEYRSVFLGAPNENIANEVKLTYKHLSDSFEEINSKNFDYYFSGSGSTKKVQLELIKSNMSGDKLEGAKFSLWNSNNIKLFEETTNVNGVIIFPFLGEGSYILKEDEAPSGYFKNNDMNINLSEDYANDGIQIENITNEKSVAADIKLVKHNENGLPLSGAEFTLYKDENVVGSPITSNADGEITFKDVELGTYTIRETKAPIGYDAKTSSISVIVRANDALKKTEVIFNGNVSTEPFVVNNELMDISGDVIINKTDSEGNPLAGAEFTIYDSGQNAIKIAISDSNGKVKFENMDLGEYTIKETKSPAGHYKSMEIVTADVIRNTNLVGMHVDFKVDGESVDIVNIENDTIDFEIEKTDKYARPLSDAEFTLYDENDVVVQVVRSNDLGKARFIKISEGNYYIKETKAPIGYKSIADIINVSVIGNDVEGTTEVIFNEGNASNQPFVVKDELVDVYGTIIINKIDSGGYPLADAEFTIYDLKENIIKTVISDSNGKVEFENMELGTYIIKETKAPEGHYKSETIITVSVTRNENLVDADVELKIDGKIVNNVIIVNDAINIEIRKTDKDDRPLSDAEFTLYDENDVVIQVIKSNDLGDAQFTKVPIGNYFIKETEAPVGYYKLDTVVEVEVKANDEPEGAHLELKLDGKLVEEVTTFVDERIPDSAPIHGKIVIEKTDENNEIVVGAEFTLYDLEDMVINNGITDSDGLLSFTEIPIGNYKLEETKAPEGYILSEENVYVEIKDEDIKVFTFVNEKEVVQPLGVIEIVKTDEDGKLLSGAWFNLYDVNDIVVENRQTVDGRILFEDLPEGQYTIKEVYAPEGYDLSDEVILVNVVDINKITFNVENKLSEIVDSNETTGTVETDIRGNILINKTDEDSQPLAGAEFALYDESGEVIETITSDDSGKVLFVNLSAGTYSVRETKAPEDYELVSQAKFVEIDQSKTYNYKFINVSEETIFENPDIPAGWIEIDDPIIPEGSMTLPDTGSILNMWMLLAAGFILTLVGMMMKIYDKRKKLVR